MKTQSPDTHPAAEAVQIELLRRASPARRFGLVRTLSRDTIQLARRAMRRTNPEASPQELDLLFIEIHYGQELAKKLKNYLLRSAL